MTAAAATPMPIFVPSERSVHDTDGIAEDEDDESDEDEVVVEVDVLSEDTVGVIVDIDMLEPGVPDVAVVPLPADGVGIVTVVVPVAVRDAEDLPLEAVEAVV
jgi:hypothetical protein